MKLAFSKPTADDDERERLFSRFRTAGYDGLQLKPAQYGDYLGCPERFVEDWGDVPGVAAALIFAAALDAAGVRAIRDLFQFARAVGAERIVFCHLRSRQDLTDVDIKGFARILSELGKEARQPGLKLSLHHHYDQPVMYRRDVDLFFGAVEEQAVGLTVDTAHLVKSGIDDIADLILDFRQVIDNFHLKDFAGGEWRLLGRGAIDFDPIFAAIQEIKFDGWLSADEESGSDLVGAMEECYQFMAARLPPGLPSARSRTRRAQRNVAGSREVKDGTRQRGPQSGAYG